MAKNSENLAKKLFKRTKKVCPICGSGASKITYKNPKLLFKFISERGRILPRRITSVCAEHQRKLKNSIKQSRLLALLSFATVK